MRALVALAALMLACQPTVVIGRESGPDGGGRVSTSFSVTSPRPDSPSETDEPLPCESPRDCGCFALEDLGVPTCTNCLAAFCCDEVAICLSVETCRCLFRCWSALRTEDDPSCGESCPLAPQDNASEVSELLADAFTCTSLECDWPSCG